ncbi:alpha/beta hydrolase [Limosilactobacillus caccae]|uniref:alpha/beta hydrolase n=1 Tax=Limosilactobacillus caccae TaxID=1926284 RepID=UPI001F382728|nr:alpha/beta hydrolase [Limosilactobacillus caccae]
MKMIVSYPDNVLNAGDTAAITEAARQMFKAGDDKRDAGLPHVLKGVTRHDDLSYGPDPKWNLLDIYTPTNYTGKLPTIISSHGGDWCYGTKETYQYFGMTLAQKGFAFVNFNYHLAPTATYPEQTLEANKVMHWVAANAEKYDLDLNNVILTGDSAGAQITAQLLVAYTNPKYRQLFNGDITVPKFNIRAGILNSGSCFVLTPGMIDPVSSAYFTPEKVASCKEQLEVEKYMTTALPPLFIQSGSIDMLRDLDSQLYGYLMAKGIKAVHRVYGTPDEPQDHDFIMDPCHNEVAMQAIDDEVAFIREYLK